MVKKSYIVVGLILFLAIASILIYAIAPVIVLDAKFPKVNDSFAVLKTKELSVTGEYVSEFGKKLGITGDVKSRQYDNVLNIGDERDGSTPILHVYKNSGAIYYAIPDKICPSYNIPYDPEPELPPVEEAKEIATEFLLKRDLLPDDAKFESVTVGATQGLWEAGNDEPIAEYNTTLHVRFCRYINGVPVEGDGLTVFIGDNGEIVGLTRNWRHVEPEPYKEVEIKTPEEAYEELTSGKVIQPAVPIGVDSKVTIKEISIVYWMRPCFEKQEYVLPVYRFSGTYAGEDGEESFELFVPAVRSDEMKSEGVTY